MLQVSLFRHVSETSGASVVTKKIRVDDDRHILFQIESSKPHVISLMEGAIVDAVADAGKADDTASYFSFVLDRLNRHLRAVGAMAADSVRVFLAAIDSDDIHFSVLGNYNVYLVRGGRIEDIALGMGSDTTEFSYVSSGSVRFPDAVYVANADLLDYLTEDDVFELSSAGRDQEKRLAIENLIRREAGNRTIDCIAVAGTATEPTSVPGTGSPVADRAVAFAKRAAEMAVPAIRRAFDAAYARAAEMPALKNAVETVRNAPIWKDPRVRTAAFGLGILVSIVLLYGTAASLFSQKTDTAVPEEYRNRLIEAQLIVEKAGKDLANREAFKESLKRAEDLIFEVRGKGVYLNDVKRLLDTISVLKKQMNGIESFDPKTHETEYAFQNREFGPVGVFEVAKKYYFVGKNGIVGPYLKGSEPKSSAYPDGEEAVSADATAEGVIYVLTKTNRVLRFSKGEFSYVNVEGQRTWEAGQAIKTFNSNLYLLSADGSQVYKHKPGVNGFSAKTSVFESQKYQASPALDVAIDGAFYVLKKDLTVDRVFSTPNYSERSVILNGLPEGYALTSENDPPKLTVSPNANYVYMVLENRIWIFEPDSRNYKDVKSLRYVGQIEVVDDTVRAIHVPKDGTVFATTDVGAYQIRFEVSDGRIVIR